MTDDIVEFICARLADDERPAKVLLEAGRGEWAKVSSFTTMMGSLQPEDLISTASNVANRHIERQDPARVFRGVKWKRKLLTLHGAGLDAGDTMAHECPDEIDPRGAYGLSVGYERECLTLRLLASEWSDHKDYQEGWRP